MGLWPYIEKGEEGPSAVTFLFLTTPEWNVSHWLKACFSHSDCLLETPSENCIFHSIALLQWYIFSILPLSWWGEINSQQKSSSQCCFLGIGLGEGANNPRDPRGNVAEGQRKLSLPLTFLLSLCVPSPVVPSSTCSLCQGRSNASCLLHPSILHLPLAPLMKVLWGLSLYFALRVCSALILQGAIELPTFVYTATDAGRPRISQNRSTSPPPCWPEEPSRLATFKFRLPRFFFPHWESSPEFIFEGIMLFYEVAFYGYLWTMAVDIKCFLITLLHCTSIDVSDFYTYVFTEVHRLLTFSI